MLCGVVLAGGKSTRMGVDKLALELDGASLLQRAVDLLCQSGAEQIFLSGKPRTGPIQGTVSVPDIDLPHAGGPPRALYSVLSWLDRNDGLHDQQLLVIPGDMPGLVPLTLKRLIPDSEACLAVHYAGEVFPLYVRACQEVFGILANGLNETAGGDGQGRPYSMKRFLAEAGAELRKSQGLPENSFMNINAPEDWQAWLDGRSD